MIAFFPEHISCAVCSVTIIIIIMNYINICVNTPRFEIPITPQQKVLLLSKSSMRWTIDASLMWRCLKFEINFRNVVSGVIKKCPELGACAKFTHS